MFQIPFLLQSTNWRPPIIEGGQVQDVDYYGTGIYRVHRITSTTVVTVHDVGTEGWVSLFVVGGGGGGPFSSSAGGLGGGAGGQVRNTSAILTLGSYAATVGNGGPGRNTNGNGFPGEDSSLFGVVAKGGGGGYLYTTNSVSWDGPAGGMSGNPSGGVVGAGYSGTPIGYPYNGGRGYSSINTHAGGGGAGAASAGGDASPAGSVYTRGGDGGGGEVNNWYADGVTYYGGGAGGGTGAVQSGLQGIGGIGGGADGVTYGQAGNHGEPLTGGGGSGSTVYSGSGGSGIILIRYRLHP